MNKLKHISSLMLTGIILLTFSFVTGCKDDAPRPISDYDQVKTERDLSIDFTKYSTYSLPEKVVKVVNGDPSDDMPGEIDALILSQIADNMDRLGYVNIGSDANQEPDVALLVTAFRDDYIVYDGYPFWDWWGWWPLLNQGQRANVQWEMGWWPGWGYYTKFSKGTLLITMVETKAETQKAEELNAIWNATLKGYAEGSENSQNERLERNIDLAFLQSDYLGVEIDK